MEAYTFVSGNLVEGIKIRESFTGTYDKYIPLDEISTSDESRVYLARNSTPILYQDKIVKDLNYHKDGEYYRIVRDIEPDKPGALVLLKHSFFNILEGKAVILRRANYILLHVLPKTTLFAYLNNWQKAGYVITAP